MVPGLNGIKIWVEQSYSRNGYQIEEIKYMSCINKKILMTTDIFLFDVGKAHSDDDVNYELLEKIKNGRVLASKFDSKELKFHTPNAVVVFSNEKPDVTELYLLHC